MRNAANIWATVRAAWPLMLIGAIIVTVLLTAPNWLKGHGCTVAKTGNASRESCALWYDYLVAKGAGIDLGLALVGVPLALGFMREKIESFIQTNVSEGVATSMSALAATRRHLERGELPSRDVSDLLAHCIRFYDGKDQHGRAAFGEHIKDMLDALGRRGTVPYRWNQSSTYRLKHPDRPVPGCMEYHEKHSYQVAARRGEQLPIDAWTAVPLPPAALEEALKHWSFTFEVEAFAFRLDSNCIPLDATTLRAGQSQQYGAFAVWYADDHLQLRLRDSCTLSTDNPMVRREETGLVSAKDCEYTTSLRDPTRHVEIEVEVPSDYEISASSFNPKQLQLDANERYHDNQCRVRQSYDNWLMPGICSVVVWRPRTP